MSTCCVDTHSVFFGPQHELTDIRISGQIKQEQERKKETLLNLTRLTTTFLPQTSWSPWWFSYTFPWYARINKKVLRSNIFASCTHFPAMLQIIKALQKCVLDTAALIFMRLIARNMLLTLQHVSTFMARFTRCALRPKCEKYKAAVWLTGWSKCHSAHLTSTIGKPRT